MKKHIFFGLLLTFIFFNIDANAEKTTNIVKEERLENQINLIEIEKNKM